MAFDRLTDALAFIAALDDEPNDVGGLTADQLKAKFDQAPLAIQTYINDVLLPQLESIIDGASASELLGSATITGVTGHTIYEQLADLKNQIVGMVSGAIPDESLADAKLVSTAGQLKSRVAALQAFPTATGTGTAIAVACPYAALADGEQATFIAAANNSGAATTLDLGGAGAKSVYKPNTTAAPNLTAGKAYTVWFSLAGDCFFVKAGAEGTAIAAHVLTGDTFSNDDDVGIAGTMVSRAGNNTALSSAVSSTTLRLVAPAGYYDGTDDTVQVTDADFISGNIRAGVNLFGVAGDSNVVDTSAGTAVAGDILSGKLAVVDGVILAGTIPSKAAATITPGTSDQSIVAGQYLSGTQTISGDADLVSGNIKAGVNIFGVAGNSNVVDTSAGDAVAGDILSGKKVYVDGALVTGNIASKGAATITPTTSNQTIAAGQYLSGAQTIAGDADLVAGNIKSGVNLFGVDGTYAGAFQVASAEGVDNGNASGVFAATVGFAPRYVMVQVWRPSNSTLYTWVYNSSEAHASGTSIKLVGASATLGFATYTLTSTGFSVTISELSTGSSYAFNYVAIS